MPNTNPVAVPQQIHHRVAHTGAAQHGRDELGGAVGFVARAEAPGEEQDL